MRTYRELFSVGEFRALFISSLFNVVAGATASLALGSVIYVDTGSAALTALGMFGGPLLAFLASTFLLSASDILRPRRALMLSSGIEATASSLQSIPALPWFARFMFLAVVWLVLAATGGTALALMSELLPQEAFVLGRATLNIAVGSMQILAFAVGGLLLSLGSPTFAFLMAAALSLLACIYLRLGLSDHAPRVTGAVITRTRNVNRKLLWSPDILPIYLSSWIPNGLITGCEALYIPYAGNHAGYFLAGTASGMLTGDVLVGRFTSPAWRDRLLDPLRLLLAIPFLVFWFAPSLFIAVPLIFIAGIGYAASLPLQERLITRVANDERGQALALRTAGMSTTFGICAVSAGMLADRLGGTHSDIGRTMGIFATVSVLVTIMLMRSLRKSAISTEIRLSEAPRKLVSPSIRHRKRSDSCG